MLSSAKNANLGFVDIPQWGRRATGLLLLVIQDVIIGEMAGAGARDLGLFAASR